MSAIFLPFATKYGAGFEQRALEAIVCHRTSSYLATCVMAGAAAESILLAVAIAKIGNEADVLKEYASRNGRSRVTLKIVSGLKDKSGSRSRRHFKFYTIGATTPRTAWRQRSAK